MPIIPTLTIAILPCLERMLLVYALSRGVYAAYTPKPNPTLSLVIFNGIVSTGQCWDNSRSPNFLRPQWKHVAAGIVLEGQNLPVPSPWGGKNFIQVFILQIKNSVALQNHARFFHLERHYQRFPPAAAKEPRRLFLQYVKGRNFHDFRDFWPFSRKWIYSRSQKFFREVCKNKWHSQKHFPELREFSPRENFCSLNFLPLKHFVIKIDIDYHSYNEADCARYATVCITYK